MSLSIIILAAGKGRRMHSDLPKVLHRLGNSTLLEHVVATAQTLSPEKIFVVYGHAGDRLKQQLAHLDVEWIEQKEQKGTGHAVSQAMPFVPADHKVLILLGDVPLIAPQVLQNLLTLAKNKQSALLSAHHPHPHGFGRIIRNQLNQVVSIVEEKDADKAQQTICEINTGIMCLHASKLANWLPKLSNENAQGEYYLTDVVAISVNSGEKIASLKLDDFEQIQGVNDRAQLANLERTYQRRQAKQFILQGLTLADPARFDLRGELTFASNVFIDINAVLEGKVQLGEGCHIEPNCVIRNSTIGANVVIKANSVIEDAVIGDECTIGPFARIRPGTTVQTKAKIGNFVEVKKSDIGEGSKVSHLSYIGDCEIGKQTNIGAGTITCNYDGINKHRTQIGDDVFIGSGTQLIAPITVASKATIGAGSTLTKDVPGDQLTLTRNEQKSIAGWKRPKRKQTETVK